MKLKNSVKKWVNLWEVENDGSFLPDELSDHDVALKTLQGDVFSSTITHTKISGEFLADLPLPNILDIFKGG
eukprot:UN21791